MAEAVADKKKIKDDEFDIHGDLAVAEADDKSFVVLYDSSKESTATAETPAAHIEAPTLDDINESHVIDSQGHAHPEDAYIDEILSSDDIELPEEPSMEPAHASAPISSISDHPENKPAAPVAGDDDDGPIALSSEELDGILEMGPASEEEFHPDFPPEAPAEAETPEPEPVLEPVSDAGYEDDELPIALSDEDLDEILLEEEGGDISPAPAAPAAAADPGAAPTLMDEPLPEPVLTEEEEEPIALSDDELDHILADAEAGHPELPAETVPPIEDEILTLDEEPEITMIDDGPATAEAPATSTTEARGGFFDSDEDEPITLSDEELDGILSTAPEEAAPAQTEEMALNDLPDDGVVEVQDEKLAVDDDEPVALSSDELDGILMDAGEPAEGTDAALMGESADEAGLADLPPEEITADSKGFFDGDEDEPIALSADELDGIAATATHEEHHEGAAPAEALPELAELPPDDSNAAQLMDERYADVDHMDTGDAPAQEAVAEPAALPHEEDEGPIALSTDELEGIVADAREVTPEAPMVGLSPMDASPSEPSLAENKDKPATVFEEDLEAATLIHEDENAAAAPAVPTPDTEELKSVMSYLDNLLGELPDDVIEKFAQSEYFKLYQKIMDKLGL